MRLGIRAGWALLIGFALVAAACGTDASDPQAGGDASRIVDDDGGPLVTFDLNEDAGALADLVAAEGPDPSVFCEPAQQFGVVAEPVAGERGITDTTVKVGVVVVDLSQLEPLGFAVDIGPTQHYWETFLDMVNTECGGMNGRTFEPTYYEIGAIDENERRQACIDATERDGNFIVVNSNGFAGDAVLCITETNETIGFLITGESEQYYARSQGRLVTLGLSFSRQLVNMVRVAHANGLMTPEDQIGLVWPDSAGQPEAVADMITTLQELGYGDQIAVRAEIACGGTSFCTQGTGVVISEMVDKDVSVVFNMLNTVSAPPFTNEAAVQGADWRYIASGFNSMGGDLTNSKFSDTEFGGAAHDGTYIIDTGDTGNFRNGDAAPEVGVMCNNAYQARGGEAFDYTDPIDNTKFGAVSSVCSMVRVMYQALTSAGPAPTTENVVDAWLNLGPVNHGSGAPAGFVDGRADAPQSVRLTQYHDDCKCVTPVPGWSWIPAS